MKESKALHETFIFEGKKILVRENWEGSGSTRMSVGDLTEAVEPKEGGFLTGPRSLISKRFNREGAMFIPAACGSSFATRLRERRMRLERKQFEQWIQEKSGAVAGLMFGELRPGLKTGWYVVLMMKVERYGGFVPYPQPGYEYLGDHPMCEHIRTTRGVQGIYHHDADFFVTLVSKEEVIRMYQTRRL